MNTNAHTVRRSFTAFAAATAFFAVTACGAEVAPPSQDIGGTQQKQAEAPAQPTKTTTPRGDFGDEYGQPNSRSQVPSDEWAGPRPGMDFGA
ncbi:putative small lipoprotein YifL [Nocardioides sp. BE266]|uniref:hypothetical protein n=1 Tax=Nocardioides sp. BE266 TaxID=2817725 RepID=UPI00286266DE|nr:hypothetical protein [Nocardioides sp. BE266]MDR7252551.1 putative small lipoprotein YifL [Nocardioides sp. BE266]